MPNHIYSRLFVEAAPNTLDLFIKFAADDDNILSADKIIPMPIELREASSPPQIVSEEEYAKWKAPPSDKLEKAGLVRTGPITARLHFDYLNRFGAADWYSWALKHWGTKWGFYDLDKEWKRTAVSAEIFFQTAWSPATPIIEKLATQFPEVKITYHFADEGGNFVGYQIFQNGSMIEDTNFEWKSPEGIETRKLVKYWFEEDESEE